MFKKLFFLGLVVFCCQALVNPLVLAKAKPRVAIIIDDAGPRGGYYKSLFALPGKVTVAIIPATVRAKEIAKRAKAKGFEVIGHIPMEPLYKKIESAKMLRTSMSKQGIKSNLDFYLSALPDIAGINNHMGSKVSIHKDTLAQIMQVLKRRKMFFIDSRTNSKSIIPAVAKQYGVQCLRSDIFIDGDQDPIEIEEKLHRLVNIARKRGYAIGIGHIHRQNTLRAIAKIMKKYGREVRFVGVSEIVYNKKMRQSDSRVRDKKAVEKKQLYNLDLQKRKPEGEELEKIFF
ncbi:divergent polysaccharide deacetylase family protein [Candidatus Margulisiibacteriota bacterium]